MGSLNCIEQADFTYYSTASTLTEIAFAFKPYHQSGLDLLFSSVHGHRKNFGQLPAAGFVDILGASLYSYAVPSLLGVSTSDVTNHFVETDTLLGGQSEAIIAKMATATSIPERLSSLADYFKSQLRKKCFKDPVMFSAVKHIRKNYKEININTLASACCLSEKQFERRFAAYSGFKPKLYSRITRFEEAFWNCRNYNTLTAAAHAHGYYDQAHFIHDFKMFAGFSPKKFFALVGY
jgi:AraC-like DNA-binding protein